MATSAEATFDFVAHGLAPRKGAGVGCLAQRLVVAGLVARKSDANHSFVMAGLVPAIHVFLCGGSAQSWMPATGLAVGFDPAQ